MKRLLFEIPQLWVRAAGIVVFSVLLILFINPVFLGIRNAGVYVGSAISIFGILFFACNPWIALHASILWTYEKGRILLCILIGLFSVGCLLGLVFSVCMLCAMGDQPRSEQPVVVLGCKVRGTEPSLMLKRRLDAALGYLEAHPDVPVIVCGGQGKDEAISEAACMAAYLEQHGIASHRILQEDTSVNTFENLRNAAEILEKKELGQDIILVTDGYHQFRASMTAKSLHLQTDKISAKTSWYLVPCYWLREWMGIIDYFLFG